MSERSRENLADAFAAISTGNISDAMDQLGVCRAVIQGLNPLSYSQPRIAGWAYTVKQLPRHQTAEGYNLTRHSEVIDSLAAPGDVVVIDTGGNMDACTGGALLAAIAQKRGLRGFVVDGCLRDLKDIIDLGFPAHVRGASPVRSAPDMETVGVNVPVLISGVQVKPGDLIVADDSGVIAISASLAEEVLHAALRIQENEKKLEQSIHEKYTRGIRYEKD
jgi:4-hydroxy-4-methyl-2-oxoglutarate aldolase